MLNDAIIWPLLFHPNRQRKMFCSWPYIDSFLFEHGLCGYLTELWSVRKEPLGFLTVFLCIFIPSYIKEWRPEDYYGVTESAVLTFHFRGWVEKERQFLIIPVMLESAWLSVFGILSGELLLDKGRLVSFS